MKIITWLTNVTISLSLHSLEDTSLWDLTVCGLDDSQMVRASDSHCRNHNCPGFDPSTLRHSSENCISLASFPLKNVAKTGFSLSQSEELWLLPLLFRLLRQDSFRHLAKNYGIIFFYSWHLQNSGEVLWHTVLFLDILLCSFLVQYILYNTFSTHGNVVHCIKYNAYK